MAIPKAPAGLSAKARRIWRDILADHELRTDELRILEDACREVDLIERMEAALVKVDDAGELENPLVVKGSMGQPASSPLVQEIRQHRNTLKSLFAALNLPDEDHPSSTRSSAARDAAMARWRHGA